MSDAPSFHFWRKEKSVMSGQASVGRHAVFSVQTHPKLREVWPGEPGGAIPKGATVPVGGEDILRAVFYYAPVAGAKSNVALSTEYHGTKHSRDMLIEDADFATRFAGWLRKHEGQSIATIGSLQLELE
jgi:hypothetical protein